MKVSMVTAHIKKEFINKFIEATLEHHGNTIKEEGNIRFDFLQSQKDPATFLFYEVYVSDEAIELHRQGTSYLTWRKRVKEWMACPREGQAFTAIAPKDMDMWKYSTIEGE
jgi:autoinducer 2-degrading protein